MIRPMILHGRFSKDMNRGSVKSHCLQFINMMEDIGKKIING
jgi:hypothetical protein